MHRTTIRLLLAICLLLSVTYVNAQWDKLLFRKIDIQAGLSDNGIQHILKLPDGRMAITTHKCINVYDGASFRYIYPTQGESRELPDYLGAYHVYVDVRNLLWVKDFQRVRCFDLKYFSYVENIDSIFRSLGAEEPVRDLFVDSKHHLWLITDQGKMKRTDGVPLEISLPKNIGALQDMDETEVAEQTGFSSSSHMSRCFQAEWGCTPMEYVRSHSAKQDKEERLEDKNKKRRIVLIIN